MNKLIILIFIWLGFSASNSAQYSIHDTLRGSITPERAWWNVIHYDLQLKVFPQKKWIDGLNTVTFIPQEKGRIMQIDLQEPMSITSIFLGNKKCTWKSIGAAHFVKLPCQAKTGQEYQLTIHYNGSPKISTNPPWDGGIVWRQNGAHPFIATACQGAGASMWWPCKDHPKDEADSLDISITVPSPLVAVSNGRLISKFTQNELNTFKWKVVNPINNYGVNINITNYGHFQDSYDGLKGTLDLDYYVLPQNIDTAKIHFREVHRMLDAFEYWFGPYPFYEDGYKLVETPYLGMEHQSSVTYGNKYQYGYLGRDLSQSGVGLLFDFIIVHESAHEWFANNITAADNADMWIHESFTHYAESLFLEYHFGKDTAHQYLFGVRSKIKNDRPIQGPLGVNRSGSGDMYYKGANVLHTLRQVIDNDSLWRKILIDLNQEFRHQTVLGEDVFNLIEKKSGIQLQYFYQQYIQSTLIPVLEYRIFPGGISYRWSQCVPNFSMPLDIFIDDVKKRIEPTSQWKSMSLNSPQNVVVSPHYYVSTFNLTKSLD